MKGIDAIIRMLGKLTAVYVKRKFQPGEYMRLKGAYLLSRSHQCA
jgi:hypothetical protein